MKIDLSIGDKVYFREEKTPYTVKATNGKYVICTRPLNFKKTVLYTIIDFDEQVRGPNDYVFNPYEYTDPKGIADSLIDLVKGKCIISHRHRIALNIVSIKNNHNDSQRTKK